MPGPRDYSTGTERALFRLARGTCYHPDCLVPIMREVDGHPVVNVEIGHIRGANPGSARYDPAMTDLERASFPNLLLVCTAHHKLIDRISPDDYPVQLLTGWKADAEREGGLDELRDMDGLLTESRLGELIEQAVARLGPSREVRVDLEGGLLLGTHAVSCPFGAMTELLRVNDNLDTAQQLVVVTVRNVGYVDLTVASVTLHYFFRIGDADQTESALAMLGRNDYPLLNPDMPKRVLAGDSMHWLTSMASLALIIDRAPQANFSALQAQVHLGSGERCDSALVPWGELPLAQGPSPN